MSAEPMEREVDDEVEEESVDESLKPCRPRTVTLQMLLNVGILHPGKFMSFEYMDQRFEGELLTDGVIKANESENTYATPTAWALACKRLISDKKSGSGWASVKYKGKKLDVYKSIYFKQCAQREQEQQRDSSPTEDDDEPKTTLEVCKKIFPYNAVANRNIEHDLNNLVESVPFASLGKIQPFNIAIHSETLLMIDLHSHLCITEVSGYLGGLWDNAANTVTVKKVYPCLFTAQDAVTSAAAEIERDIQKTMIEDNLKLVGWYHSHSTFDVQPTLRDCDNQLEYQLQLRGSTDAAYMPCVGFICSPYDKKSPALDSKMIAFWVTPPAETKPLEYGRPMMMVFNPIPDKNFSDGFLARAEMVVEYYRNNKTLLDLNGYFKDKITYFDALKASLTSRIPSNENKENFWNFLRDLLKIKPRHIDELDTPTQPMNNKKDANPIMRELIEQKGNSIPINLIPEPATALDVKVPVASESSPLLPPPPPLLPPVDMVTSTTEPN